MNQHVRNTVILCLIVLCGRVSGADAPASGDAIRQALARCHADAKPNGAALRVVYFHPSDVEPQPDYEGRITRIVLDIRDFLKVEMARYGFDKAVLPLEMDGDHVRIHRVVGKDGAKGYTHKSGAKTKREIREALRARLVLDKEFVLVFHGMCRIDGESKYFFYAPYYGDRGSNHQRGLCHVADCEILDPALLTDTKRRMSYEEHYGRFRQTVADFNTKYLGGVAHELGHALGLPHNGQTRDEARTLGTALMGAGNHTYRRERWSTRKGSFLTFASAVRLASHPLFTGSDRGRDKPGQSRLEDVRLGGAGKGLVITGTLSATPAAYAMIAYVDPDGRGGYDAIATAVPVTEGAFKIETVCVKGGPHQLRLVACHPNGATSTHRFTFTANEDGEPDRKSIARK
ncbi:hypothetical protein HQ576_15335 [bacterium]|nr:hypothetical protein [bacterium]